MYVQYSKYVLVMCDEKTITYFFFMEKKQDRGFVQFWTVLSGVRLSSMYKCPSILSEGWEVELISSKINNNLFSKFIQNFLQLLLKIL